MKTPKITPIEIKPGAPVPFLALNKLGTLMVVEELVMHDVGMFQLVGSLIRPGKGELPRNAHLPGTFYKTGIIVLEAWIGFTVEPA